MNFMFELFGCWYVMNFGIGSFVSVLLSVVCRLLVSVVLVVE